VKESKAPLFQIGIGMKFGKNVLNLYMINSWSDFQFDVTFSKWRPWHHFEQKRAASSRQLCSSTDSSWSI